MADTGSVYRKATEESLAKRRTEEMDSCARAWRRLRIAEWLWMGAMVTTVPGVWLVVAFGNAVVFYIWLCVTLGAFLGGGFYAANFACPGCHQCFWGRPSYMKRGVGSCRHCGLPRGATQDLDRDGEEG